MRRIGQGRTAEIFEYTSNQIMKLYHADFPAEAVQNEFRITDAVFRKGLPVPQARLFKDDESRKGIIFERIEGNTMLSLMIQEPVLIKELSCQMAVCHHSLHAQNDEEGVLPAQKQILTGAIRNTSLLSEEEKIQIITYLSTLPDRKQICHGDFHPDNVMVNETRDQYWVIDWMTGMSGDPAGDVARSWVILMSATLPEDTAPAILKGFEGVRNLLLDDYIRHYLQISGISRQEMDAWILPVAAARLNESLPGVEADQLIKLVHDRIRLLK
ncbi:phosphotransferase family protein [Paenibacillus sp. FSL K6-0108]|uniref:phosphotransferase family protein n=1 Tax=Paenibacillus sp. FSL K6-0108 TaxID=2921417 RepID=UPI0032460A19